MFFFRSSLNRRAMRLYRQTKLTASAQSVHWSRFSSIIDQRAEWTTNATLRWNTCLSHFRKYTIAQPKQSRPPIFPDLRYGVVDARIGRTNKHTHTHRTIDRSFFHILFSTRVRLWIGILITSQFDTAQFRNSSIGQHLIHCKAPLTVTEALWLAKNKTNHHLCMNRTRNKTRTLDKINAHCLNQRWLTTNISRQWHILSATFIISPCHTIQWTRKYNNLKDEGENSSRWVYDGVANGTKQFSSTRGMWWYWIW